MKWLKKALGKTGRKVAEDLVTKGYVAAHEGRLEAAHKLYLDAVDADDTLAVAFFNAGQVELELFNRDHSMARLSSAAAHLQRGLALDAAHAPSWRTLARVQERQGQFAAAVDAWLQVRARLATAEPAGPFSQERGKDIEEARREAERLRPWAELEQALTSARAALGADVDVAAASLALSSLEEIWERSAAAGVAEPPRLLTLLGALARKIAEVEQARAYFEAAIAGDKHDLEALKALATICLEQGDLKAALTSSMAAYRADPVDAGLVCNVGVCHLALGELAAAREFIELAAGMAPKDPIVARAVAALAPR
ncbi:MAG: tetratricopeptide repeat protein [Deltaproteobacteria bacterium]|nr:tetratricopeptide repeat protein [Deltaproteobacteria bacterium]